MENELSTQKKDNLKKSNQESKTLTREYIRTALLLLMKEIPFEKITVTSIINRAGVSRAGFYRNYGNKDDVLEDLALCICQKISDTYLQDLTKDNMYEKYVHLFQQFKNHSEWFKIINMLRLYNNHTLNFFSIVDKHWKQESTDDYYIHIAIAHSQHAIVLAWFENGMKDSPEEMASIFCKIYQHI